VAVVAGGASAAMAAVVLPGAKKKRKRSRGGGRKKKALKVQKQQQLLEEAGELQPPVEKGIGEQIAAPVGAQAGGVENSQKANEKSPTPGAKQPSAKLLVAVGNMGERPRSWAPPLAEKGLTSPPRAGVEVGAGECLSPGQRPSQSQSPSQTQSHTQSQDDSQTQSQTQSQVLNEIYETCLLSNSTE
jgi:hypothetical protein